MRVDTFEAGEETSADQTETILEEAENSDPKQKIDEKEGFADDEIARLNQELLATRDQLLRKASDLENIRRRAERERLQLFTSARVDAIRRFLDINDDLLRMLDASNTSEVPQQFLEGVQMIAAKFKTTLESYGVKPINETGVPFDVNRHDAMLRQPAADKKVESNTVLQVIETGYQMNDEVIRHAKVIVSE